MSLLEAAKAVPRKTRRRSCGDDELRDRTQLVLAWLRDEVSSGQMGAALGFSTAYSLTTRCQNTCASILRQAMRAGIVKIEMIDRP